MTVETALKQYIDLDFTKEEIASIQKAAETKDPVQIDDAIEKSSIRGLIQVGPHRVIQEMKYHFMLMGQQANS